MKGAFVTEPENSRPPPLGLEVQQLHARIAWHYFIGGLTQQEITNLLGLTRLRVNKVLGQLRIDGSVAVDIRLPLAQCADLAQKLAHRFGLTAVTVLPSLADADEQQRAIGSCAGRMLDCLLENGTSLGVGWGKTLTVGLKYLTPRSLPEIWVTSIMGGLTRGSGTSTFEVTTRYACAISAECFYLIAPLYFPTPESRAVLLSHHEISEVMARARSVDIAMVSCGDMSNRPHLVQTPTVSQNLEGLRAAGAVGDLLGVFLNAGGQVIDRLLNERVLSIPPAIKIRPAFDPGLRRLIQSAHHPGNLKSRICHPVRHR